jgi:hypothetical protein
VGISPRRYIGGSVYFFYKEVLAASCINLQGTGKDLEGLLIAQKWNLAFKSPKMNVRLTLEDKSAFIRNSRTVKCKAITKNIISISETSWVIYSNLQIFKIPTITLLLQVTIILKSWITENDNYYIRELTSLSSLILLLQITTKPILLHLSDLSSSDTKRRSIKISLLDINFRLNVLITILAGFVGSPEFWGFLVLFISVFSSTLPLISKSYWT